MKLHLLATTLFLTGCATVPVTQAPIPVEDAIITSVVKSINANVDGGARVAVEIASSYPKQAAGYVGSWDQTRIGRIARNAGVELSKADRRVGGTACTAGSWDPNQKDSGCPLASTENVMWLSRATVESGLATVVVHVQFSSSAKTTQGRNHTIVMKLKQNGDNWTVVETRLVAAS